MKRAAAVVLMVLAALLVLAVASHAGGGHGGGHGGQPGTCDPGHRGAHGTVFLEYPWWDVSVPYFYLDGDDSELYIADPSAIGEEVPAYQDSPAFLYYCPSAKAYYPKIKMCRDPWMKIPPPPQ